jgi:hypothetical protein
MAVSFCVTGWGNEATLISSSVPPRTIRAAVPRLVLGERVAGLIAVSMRPKL